MSMKGQCLCGDIQYEVSEFEADYANCFCTMCQKSSGSAYATYAPAKSCAIDWLRNESKIVIYRSSDTAERGFCGVCGSNLFFRILDSDEYEIALGTLDCEPDKQPTANIHNASRPKWSYGIDELESFDLGRP